MTSLMSHKLDVYQLTQTVSPTAAIDTAVGARVYKDLPCNVQPVSAQDVEEFSRQDIKAEYKVYTNVDLEAEIVVGSPPNQTKGLSLMFALYDVSRNVWYTIEALQRRYQPNFKIPIQWKIMVNQRVQ